MNTDNTIMMLLGIVLALTITIGLYEINRTPQSGGSLSPIVIHHNDCTKV